MTPDEVVKGLQEMASDCATRVSEVIDNQLDQDYHDEELKKSNTLDSAISLIQNYQKIRGKIEVGSISGIIDSCPGSTFYKAQAIVNYLGGQTNEKR